MNHAWIAMLLPMFLSPRAECDKHGDKTAGAQESRTECHAQSKSSCCKQKDAKHDEDADAQPDDPEERASSLAGAEAERAEQEAERAQQRAEEQSERAEREAEAQAERAEREVERVEREAERAEREAEEQAERAERDAEDVQWDLKDRDDDPDAEGEGDSQGHARVLDLSQLDQHSAEEVRAAVERALVQAKSAMKKVKGSCMTLDKETKKRLAEALKAAKVSGTEMQKALRVNEEALAKAFAGQHVHDANSLPLAASVENLNSLRGLSRIYSTGSNDQRALEERVAALEAKLGVTHDDPHASLEERVAELERRTGTTSVHVAPRSGNRRAPRAVVVPTPPPAPPQAMAPAAPTPPQTDAPELWMRSRNPRAPADVATPAPPPPLAPPPPAGVPAPSRGRSHAASGEQRRDIQERMQKMREEMEKLREEMTRLRDEMTSGSGSGR